MYVPNMFNGKWGGTMCLTEPHAGTDVGAREARTAEAPPTARYEIHGTKIFISGGDHDLAENIIHLVLARTPDAPAGHQGPVAVHRARSVAPPDGTPNDVAVARHRAQDGHQRLGDRVLDFGENDECIGELVGDASSNRACRRCST